VENLRSKPKNEKYFVLLSDIWLYGIVVSSLVAISNLVLYVLLQNSQWLPVSIISIVVAILFLLCRRLYLKNSLFSSYILGTIAWCGLVFGHVLFWSGVNIFLLIGVWLFPTLIIISLQSIKEKLVIFTLPLIVSASVFLIERFPVFSRLSIDSFENSRFISPIYFFVFGVLIFLVFLRSVRSRTLSGKIIIAMALIVFIPIVILTMVSYSNTKINNSLAAVDSLEQIANKKSEAVIEWSSNLILPLDNLVNENDTYQLISRLLDAYHANDDRSVATYRDSLEYILSNIAARYGFEEIYILNETGIVVTSTKENYIETDFSEYDFFQSGKVNSIVLPPSYYPLEDQTSIFISKPIFTPANVLLGVLSARATTDDLIAIVDQPAKEPYQTTEAFILNSDGTLLVNSIGRSSLVVNTIGAQTALSLKENGNISSYDNIEGEPVEGVFHWLTDLNIAILVEANEAEINQRLPNIITGNIAIGMLGLILAIFASTSIVRSITSPINDMVDASKEVIAGNFNIHLPSMREDELGRLIDAFNKMTDELKVLVSDLEIRVADRTRELESRSQELEASAIIARDSSLASDMSDLLDRTASLIQERFGFYQVGIYLNDAKNEYAVLSSAAGEAGQELLSRHHKLKIGETGIVGTVTKFGEPRIALDVGADAVYFKNPLLPNTRSEMTLPLIVREQIIGALDVQSEKVSAFDQNDIRIMTVLADQLAISIERTRLVEETIKSATQLRRALQAQTSSAWEDFTTRSDRPLGYRYEGVSIKPLDDRELKPKSLDSKISISESNNPEIPGSIATVPIRLRGITIGTLELQFSTNTISAETLQFLEVAADRLSLALENARLFNEVTLRAEREKTVTNITTNIRSNTDPQVMVQTALEELKKVLGASEIRIHEITPPDASPKE
jgi:GAF domain-containing protein/HAMP domain-containing protein